MNNRMGADIVFMLIFSCISDLGSVPSNSTVITRRIKQLEEENQTLKRNLLGRFHYF